ncbi:MAG TPA: hypothetical protein VGN05_08130 [Parvibaculum sp.]|jgi:hypothetical protein
MTTTLTNGTNPFEGGLSVARPTADEIVRIHQLGAAKISADIASLDTFHQIHRHNSDSLWGVYAGDGALVGFFAFLMLTSDGVERLISGDLNTRAPTIDALAKTGEAPNAIYIWALVAEKKTANALPLILGAFDAAVYARTDLYARPATEGGLRLMAKVGFKPLGEGEIEPGELCVFRRSIVPTRIQYPGRSETAHAFV